MLHSHLFIALSLAFPQEAATEVESSAAAKAPDALADFNAACDAIVNASSYVFEMKTESLGDTGGGGGRGGRGGRGGFGGNDDGTPTVGRYQAGVPTHFVRGETEAFVSGDTIVAKNDEGAWEFVDREAMRGRGGRGNGGGRGGRGGRGQGGGGAEGNSGADGDAGKAEGEAGGKAEGEAGGKAEGDAGKAEGEAAEGDAGGQAEGGAGEGRNQRGDRGEGGRGPGAGRGGQGRGSLFAATRLQRVQLPHVLLKGAGEKVTDVVREELDGRVILRGALNEEAVMALAMGGRGGRGGFGGGRGGSGDEGPDRDVSGSFALVLSGQGAVESVVIDTHISMNFGERSFERDSKITYSISDIGSTEVEVPEEALIHFEF